MSMKDVQYNHEFAFEHNSGTNTILFVDPEQEYLNSDIPGVIIDKIQSDNNTCTIYAVRPILCSQNNYHKDKIACNKAMVYWFSRCDGEKFTVDKLNQLYYMFYK